MLDPPNVRCMRPLEPDQISLAMTATPESVVSTPSAVGTPGELLGATKAVTQGHGVGQPGTLHADVEHVTASRRDAREEITGKAAKLRLRIDAKEQGEMRARLHTVPHPGVGLCATVGDGL
jgi:hypothetical protein